MNLRELLQLFWRHKLQLWLITGLVVIAALALAATAPRTVTTTLLFTAATSDDTATEKAFDTTKLSNDFASTVSGWVRSPEFASKVGALAGLPVAVTSATQTTQNFLLTLRYADAAASDRVAAAAHEVLKTEVAKYNADAKFKFTLSAHGTSVEVSHPKWALTAVAAVIAGGALAKIWILAFAYFGGRVTAASQAAEILGVTAAAILHGNRDPRTAALGLLAEQLGTRTVLAGVDCALKPLEKQLPEKLSKLELPADLASLKANTPVLTIVKLDQTTLDTLRLLRATVPAEHLRLVIWG